MSAKVEFGPRPQAPWRSRLRSQDRYWCSDRSGRSREASRRDVPQVRQPLAEGRIVWCRMGLCDVGDATRFAPAPIRRSRHMRSGTARHHRTFRVCCADEGLYGAECLSSSSRPATMET